jgi:hypothetical protein
VPDPIPRKTTTTRPVDTATKVSKASKCLLEIAGMPVSVAKGNNHTLKVGGRPQNVDKAVLEINIEDDPTQLQLDGSKYRGSVQLHRKDCFPGATVQLQVRPIPASLTFNGAPKGTAVRCIAGPCPDTIAHLLESEGFPDIPMTTHEATLRFEIRALGFNRQERTVSIYPGRNTVTLSLISLQQR